jgi:hypothetical protein
MMRLRNSGMNEIDLLTLVMNLEQNLTMLKNNCSSIKIIWTILIQKTKTSTTSNLCPKTIQRISIDKKRRLTQST